MALKGTPAVGKHRAGQPRPHMWKTGPDDPIRHKQYLIWLQQRNQANFRGEGWDEAFDLDSWLELWGDKWEQRGREKDRYCMTRIDFDQPWSKDNCEVVTRGEHFKNHRRRMTELGKTKGYKKRLGIT